MTFKPKSQFSPAPERLGKNLLIGSKIFDPRTGRVLSEAAPRPANTLVINWFKAHYVCFTNVGLAGVIDVTNTAKTLSTNPAGFFRMEAGAGTTTYGIVVGTGTNAVTLADYKLQTQVTTNVVHGANVITLNAPDADHYEIIHSRSFTNNTGSTLLIREVGLYFYAQNLPAYFCFDRTLYSVDVLNGLATTLTYTWSISV